MPRGRPLTTEDRRKGGRRVHETGAFRGHLFTEDASECGAKGGRETARNTRGKAGVHSRPVIIIEDSSPRHQTVCRLHNEGRSLNWIAAATGLSQGGVVQILRRYRPRLPVSCLTGRPLL